MGKIARGRSEYQENLDDILTFSEVLIHANSFSHKLTYCSGQKGGQIGLQALFARAKLNKQLEEGAKSCPARAIGPNSSLLSQREQPDASTGSESQGIIPSPHCLGFPWPRT